MIISEEKYCIASKTFPLKFYRCGNETDEFEHCILRSKESCEEEFKKYVYYNLEKFQILKVKITYEL